MNDREAATRNWEIIVIGIGGVGGYFGGLLARHCGESRAEDKIEAGEGQPEARITFVARGAHLRAIREQGLVLNTAGQNGLLCRPDRATDAIEQLEAPDLCLVCVKGYDLDGVSRRLAPLVRSDTVIMPLLNGGQLFGGTILRLGKELGVPTPVAGRLYGQIEERLGGTDGSAGRDPA